MTSSLSAPWSVKGVDPEAREAAKLAARKAGMPIGVWLCQTIRAAAATELKHNGGAGNTAPPHPPSPPRPQSSAQPQPDTKSAAQPQPDTKSAAQPPAPTIQTIHENIQRLYSRIESVESNTTDAIAPIAERVDKLSLQLDEMSTRPAGSTAPVERAVTRLSERIDQIEEAALTSSRRARGGLFGRLR